MYQIKCDGHILYDPRDDELIVYSPRCNLAANTVGEASFTIMSNHTHFDKLKPLKSIVEILQDGHVIFRGRMTNDSKDFYNRLDVDLEGILGFANDSIIEPFLQLPIEYMAVEDVLEWVLDNHNAQVESWQQLRLGNVEGFPDTIERSSEKHISTWEFFKTKLFESSLGGYLIIRYEDDGNYVDYVKTIEETASQQITFGKNLLDIIHATDASETYSAILPLGKETQVETGSDYEGDYVEITNTVKERISLKNVPNGALTSDLFVKGKFLYSKSAVEKYGWICAPVDDTTWDDIGTENGLKNKAIEYLSGTAMALSDTIEINAVDLSFTDDQIQSFRINQNVVVNSPAHGISNVIYPLSKLEIDITNPQNTKITLGETKRVLTDKTNQVDEVKKSNTKTNSDVSAIKVQLDDKVGKKENDHVVNMVNDATAVIELIGKRLRIEAENCTLEDDGTLTVKNAHIEGDLTAGSVGGFIIEDGILKSADADEWNNFELSASGFVHVSSHDSGYKITKIDDDGLSVETAGTDIEGSVLMRFKHGSTNYEIYVGNDLIVRARKV